MCSITWATNRWWTVCGPKWRKYAADFPSMASTRADAWTMDRAGLVAGPRVRTGACLSTAHALSFLRPYGDSGDRLSSCWRGATDSPAPRVPGMYGALHDFRDGRAVAAHRR